MSMTEEFDQATRRVNDDRGAVYGHPLDNFNTLAKLKAAVAHCPDKEVRHALEMVLTKVARLCTTPDHLDSVVDISGYARTIPMIHDERRARHVQEDNLKAELEITTILKRRARRRSQESARVSSEDLRGPEDGGGRETD